MIIDEKQTIWTEKYKPSNIDDIILPESLRKSIKEGLEKHDIPNLGLWSYLPGLGKSSLANVIANNENVEPLWINASLNKGIDVIRNDIHAFASRRSFDGRLKVVIMDESDKLTQDFQAGFRGFIDEFSQNCRFIFTGNYKENIIEPLLNRLENYDFLDFDKQEIIPQIVTRILFILEHENIKSDNNAIKTIIEKNYPSVRGMILDLKKFSNSGTLNISGIKTDELDSAVKAMMSKSFNRLNEIVNSLSCPDAFYSILYKNLDKLFTQNVQFTKAVIVLAKYQDMGVRVRDKYINLLACLCELSALV
jgi:DNA polymerase III delta prime subunit